MTDNESAALLPAEDLERIFPPTRADEFFAALLGDADEGAYDIELAFKGRSGARAEFEFHLRRRPGKCLACNLTYGLPTVFSRHPVIDLSGLAETLAARLGGPPGPTAYRLGNTREISRDLHVIPLSVSLDDDPPA